MDLPVVPPVAPMLAKLIRELIDQMTVCSTTLPWKRVSPGSGTCSSESTSTVLTSVQSPAEGANRSGC